MNGFDHWVLTGAMFIPLVGAILIIFIPRQNEVMIKATALLTTLVTLGFGIYLIADFDGNGAVWQEDIPADLLEAAEAAMKAEQNAPLTEKRDLTPLPPKKQRPSHLKLVP